MLKILVAIPCYRCEKQIKRVLSTFDDALLARVHTILVIDNQSPDDTLPSASEAAARLPREKILVVRNNDNYGLGGSHKVAFQYGIDNGFDAVCILHGDNQATTSELKELIDLAESNESFGAILGSRFMFSSRLRGYNKLRIFGNVGLNAIYTVLSGRMTKDLGSGINLFRTKALAKLPFQGFADGFTFNMDLLLSYFRHGIPVRFHPITWSEEDQVSNARTFKVGWIALKTVLRWRFAAQSEKALPAAPRRYSFTAVYPGAGGGM